MDALLAAVEATPVAATLRASRWGYALLNAAHILGIGLLIGAIVPLQMRFLGLWPQEPREALVRVLVPAAATGLALAVAAGLFLFPIRAREYAGNGFMQAKLAFVLLGTASALLLHARHGAWLETASDIRLRVHAAISLLCWPAALLCGRLIAFAGD